jgi:hypothetical protein
MKKLASNKIDEDSTEDEDSDFGWQYLSML